MKRTLVLFLLLAPRLSFGYSDTGAFALDPSADTAGGGGGLYFTGAPRQHGLSCVACHIEGPAGTSLRLSALLDGEEADLFSSGYEPGKIYEIEVAFDGVNLAPEAGCSDQAEEPCDLNLFALEIDDAEGKSAGALCPIQPDPGPSSGGCDVCRTARSKGTRVDGECEVVMADGFDDVAMSWRNGVTAFSFFWTAPATDLGPVSLYVSAVDGRGREVPDGEVTSYVHDGVVTLEVPLRSPSFGLEEPDGCSTSGSSPSFVAGFAALGLVVLGRIRRRPRDQTRRTTSSLVPGLVGRTSTW